MKSFMFYKYVISLIVFLVGILKNGSSVLGFVVGEFRIEELFVGSC